MVAHSVTNTSKMPGLLTISALAGVKPSNSTGSVPAGAVVSTNKIVGSQSFSGYRTVTAPRLIAQGILNNILSIY